MTPKQKRRRQKRNHVALPVKVCLPGIKTSRPHPACTLDLASGGVRLSGFRYEVAAGSVIALERGKQRVNFRVAWVGKPGTRHEGQVGLECVEPVTELWGVEFAASDHEFEEHAQPRSAAAAAAAAANHDGLPQTAAQDGHHPGETHAGSDQFNLGPRIAHVTSTLGIARYPCSGDVEWRPEGADEDYFKSRVREVGPRGCFALTNARVPVGTRVQLVLKAVGHLVHARATVRNADDAGMWLEFFDLHPEEMQSLLYLIDHIAVS